MYGFLEKYPHIKLVEDKDETVEESKKKSS
jgi:hypothetical protein